MLGHILYVAERGRYPSLARVTVQGLSLLRADIPALPGAKETSLRRRADRAARLLVGAEVRRVLAPPAFPYWDILERWGLRPVETAVFCQTLAAPLALAALARQGTPTNRATVALRGSRVSRPLFQAALELAPAVRGLVVAAPIGGEALSVHLRREYGVPVVEAGAGVPPNLILAFSPTKCNGVETLALYGPEPDLAGLRVRRREGTWPEDFTPLPLAAALWEEGALALCALVCE